LTLIWIIVGILALLLAAVIFVAWALSSMIVHPKVWDYYKCVDEEVSRGNFTREWFDGECKLEEFYLPSQYGYRLHCALWPHKQGACFEDGKARVAVIVHGYTYCLIGSLKYAAILHELGFDCVLYDHRNHGLSDKAPTTMGYYESRDLSTVCDWARERFGSDCVLGTHGESMGAATVMLHASQYPGLAFVIEDCGYSDLRAQLKHNVKQMYHLPYSPFVPLASLLSRLRGGVYFRNVVPVESVAKCDTLPMLFIHGEKDDFVPFPMVHEVYSAKPGKKQIKTFPNAKHAESFTSDPQEYRACVSAFLLDAGVIRA